MNNRIYLVTGAAGFLGGTICRQLVARGEKVRAFVLPNDKSVEYLPHEAEICAGDLCDSESLKRFFAVSEDQKIVVIHVASIVTVNPEYNQKVMDVNVGGTKKIIEQCRHHANFEKLVYVSSTGCVPELPKGQAIREITHFSAEGLRDCYSQSKALATQAVLDAAAKGLNACVVHPTGIMGPEDYAVGHTTRVLAQIINGEMSAAIAGTFNLADVRDLAAGTIAAVERGRKGECYILGNEAVSFKKFSQLVVREAGCKKIKFFMPGKLAYWLAGKMEKKAAKKGGHPKMTTYAVWNLIRNNVFDSSKAMRELGYHTRPFQETMHDQIAWMKDAGLIHATSTGHATPAKVLALLVLLGIAGISNNTHTANAINTTDKKQQKQEIMEKQSKEKSKENPIVEGYKAVEKGVTKGYKAVENAFVKGYEKVENACVSTLFGKKDETPEETKARLKRAEENARKISK